MTDTPLPDLAHARWEPRLSEYLDGTLAADERAACAAHLAQCAACRATLDELTEVVGSLRTLATTPLVPDAGADDSWQALAARLPARRARWPGPTPWLAAAAAIALVAVGVVLGRQAAPALARRTDRPPAPPTAAAPDAAAPRMLAATDTPTAGPGAATTALAAARTARPSYDVSVRELEALLAAERATLAPETVAILERSLRTIDAAIADAQRAVASDPANPYLESHLARTRARKLALLRQAVQLGQS